MPTSETVSAKIGEVLNMTAAADELGVSYATMVRWMKSGYIGYLKSPSGRKRITREEIERIKTDMVNEATHG